jgi:hypothetical protein
VFALPARSSDETDLLPGSAHWCPDLEYAATITNTGNDRNTPA